MRELLSDSIKTMDILTIMIYANPRIGQFSQVLWDILMATTVFGKCTCHQNQAGTIHK